MKRILLTTTVVFALFAAKAQTEVFYFKPIPRNLDDSQVDQSLVENHFLGREIAVKLEILKNSYTWEDSGDPTRPAPRQVIEKPNIYLTVRKIERFYKKQLKDELISEEVAREEFGKILNIAIYIRNQQTSEFEEVLRKVKEEQDLVVLFTKSVQLEN